MASLYSLRKNSMLHLILGGAAVHRCDKRPVFGAGFKPLRCDCDGERHFFRKLFSDAVSSLISDAPFRGCT
jgi:hypothetical protein